MDNTELNKEMDELKADYDALLREKQRLEEELLWEKDQRLFHESRVLEDSVRYELVVDAVDMAMVGDGHEDWHG